MAVRVRGGEGQIYVQNNSNYNMGLECQLSAISAPLSNFLPCVSLQRMQCQVSGVGSIRSLGIDRLIELWMLKHSWDQ